ncbi:GAF domain-containing protein [Methylobacterium sp. BTF04]|uniref:GAF domain-containing protein n=1 Tax=Methylobacterium sp. BTF04 TaxID=2708300 RepID=UPI0032B14061
MELHRAFAIQRRVLNQREALIRTQATVLAARGDLSIILDALVTGPMEGLSQAEGGVIEVRDCDEFVYHAISGTLIQYGGFRVPLHGSHSGSCLLAGEPALVPDVHLDDRVRQDLAEDMRLRSCVLLPVWPGGKAVAVLKLQSNQPNAVSQADLTYAQVVAGTVSVGFAEAGEAAARREVGRSERRRQAVFDSAIDYAIILGGFSAMSRSNPRSGFRRPSSDGLS